MIRKPWGGLCAAILMVGLVSLGSGMSTAESLPEPIPPVRLVAVKAVEQPGGASLQVLASGPFSFTSYQPNERSLIVDLTGVVSEPAALEPAADLAWMASYRLLPFRNASGRPVLRLDIALGRDCAVELVQPTQDALTLSCPGAAAASVRSAEPADARASVAPASSEPVLVRRVVVDEKENGITIKVKASGRLRYQTLTLEKPTRLVVDLPQSILVSRQRRLPVDEQAVVGVRLAQFQAQPPITRLVVDLREMVPYEISPTADGLRVTLQFADAATNQAAPVPAPIRVETPPPAPVSATLVEKAAPETQAVSSEPAPTLVASLVPTIPSDPASTRTSVDTPDPMEMATSTPAPALAAPPAVTPPAPPAPPQQAVTASAQAPAEYSGEPISVNLKDVDLKDFFRLIHEISGLNIVVDPNVSGSVTLVLIDVPWDQALDIVLRNNGLSSTLEGNVLRIATRTTLKQEQEEERDLAQARAEAVDPVMVTRQLSYARATELEPTLKRFLSSRGELIKDDRTNTLIIRDIPSVIPAIDNLINQLDRKSLQVEIEARVVSASRAFSREIGTQFATSFSTTGGRSVFGGALGPSPFGPGAIPPPLIASGSSDQQPLVSDLAVAATSGFLFAHRSPSFALDTILTAAESRNIAKVLSKPRLITQNNIQAEVKQGTRIPVQTVVNNTISTQFLDVVLRLSVKPQITADGTVFLDIVIENTSIDPGIARINGIPALATQSTTTQVLIGDGGTVVIGGVMVTNNSTTIDQVPLFGSIPIIGHLFKRTSVSTSTQELLFFITPRILQG